MTNDLLLPPAPAPVFPAPDFDLLSGFWLDRIVRPTINWSEVLERIGIRIHFPFQPKRESSRGYRSRRCELRIQSLSDLIPRVGQVRTCHSVECPRHCQTDRGAQVMQLKPDQGPIVVSHSRPSIQLLRQQIDVRVLQVATISVDSNRATFDLAPNALRTSTRKSAGL